MVKNRLWKGMVLTLAGLFALLMMGTAFGSQATTLYHKGSHAVKHAAKTTGSAVTSVYHKGTHVVWHDEHQTARYVHKKTHHPDTVKVVHHRKHHKVVRHVKHPKAKRK
jgi:hypothetical protein